MARKTLRRMKELAGARPSPQPTFFHRLIFSSVTHVLYGDFQKAQACSMREGSANQFETTQPRTDAPFLASSEREQACPPPVEGCGFFRPRAKSLFRKILAISPCGSRFCEETSRPLRSNPLRMNILRESWKKTRRNLYAAKSLFWKILAVSPCGSRFCEDASCLVPASRSE